LPVRPTEATDLDRAGNTDHDDPDIFMSSALMNGRDHAMHSSFGG
jgi:hypothetical protein